MEHPVNETDLEIRERVRAAFAAALELERGEVGDNAAFYEELGGDSLQKLDLAVALEREFRTRLTDEQVVRMSTVSRAVAELRSMGVT